MTTTTTTTPSSLDGEVSLAVSILTILTTLCQTGDSEKKESLECIRAQENLLKLVDEGPSPWLVRGSSNGVSTALERGLLDFIGKSRIETRDFGLPRNEALSYNGFSWSTFFKGLQGLFAIAGKLKDPMDFVKDIKDYLLREPEVSSEKLKVFMDLHQIEQITKVLSAIHSAEAKVVYIIGALIVFLVLTTCVWLSLNIRSYCEQRKARKAQKASRQAGVMLREMQVARRNQLAGMESRAHF